MLHKKSLKWLFACVFLSAIALHMILSTTLFSGCFSENVGWGGGGLNSDEFAESFKRIRDFT